MDGVLGLSMRYRQATLTVTQAGRQAGKVTHSSCMTRDKGQGAYMHSMHACMQICMGVRDMDERSKEPREPREPRERERERERGKEEEGAALIMHATMPC
jgi:hypothetical protein